MSVRELERAGRSCKRVADVVMCQASYEAAETTVEKTPKQQWRRGKVCEDNVAAGCRRGATTCAAVWRATDDRLSGDKMRLYTVSTRKPDVKCLLGQGCEEGQPCLQ
jgi:hypothetical protein